MGRSGLFSPLSTLNCPLTSHIFICHVKPGWKHLPYWHKWPFTIANLKRYLRSYKVSLRYYVLPTANLFDWQFNFLAHFLERIDVGSPAEDVRSVEVQTRLIIDGFVAGFSHGHSGVFESPSVPSWRSSLLWSGQGRAVTVWSRFRLLFVAFSASLLK